MCGRFARAQPVRIIETFDVPNFPDFGPLYNIAPTQDIPIVRAAETKGMECVIAKWGLIPCWAKDPSIGNSLINARSETAATKPSFRSAFKKRRCLIPVDGFYEWKKLAKGKQPYFIHKPDGEPFAFAGLWEHWEQEGEVIESCTILTTSANGTMTPLHDRMPVILGKGDWKQWLDVKETDAEKIQPFLVPCPDDWLTAYPVSTYVNNARNQGPKCIEPAEAA